MEVIRGFKDLRRSLIRPVLTLGNFDGVHLGHQRIIELAKAAAKSQKGQAILYTFRPHPQRVLRPGVPIQLLTSYDEKLELLEQMGIDVTLEEPFQIEFSNLTPTQFFSEILIHKLNAQEIVVGYDFSFGKAREGHLEVLGSLCSASNVKLTVVPPFRVDEEIVSSTRIRVALKEGKIELANRLLGRPFQYSGVVIKGDQRGRTIGFPTANFAVEDKVILPLGVYSTSTWVDGHSYPSVTNLGVRPTFHSGAVAPIIETHLLNQDMDLYGKIIQVHFYFKIREEMKFSGIDALKEQIQKDIEEARRHT